MTTSNFQLSTAEQSAILYTKTVQLMPSEQLSQW